MLRRLLLWLLLSLPAAPASAQLPADAARLRQIEERGRLLYEVDRAAWVTTDDMMEKLGGRRDVPIRGWVVERDGVTPRAYVVTYFGDGASGPVVWYVGRVRDNAVTTGELLPAQSRPALTSLQLRLMKAVETARRIKKYRPCTPARFNVAAIPPTADADPIDVYLLSAQTETDLYPFGGHYLLQVGGNGKIVSRRKFTNSCVNIRKGEGARENEEVAALTITHLLDPTPTEIHVFLSLSARVPVYVGTAKQIWEVAGDHIERVD